MRLLLVSSGVGDFPEVLERRRWILICESQGCARTALLRGTRLSLCLTALLCGIVSQE